MGIKGVKSGNMAKLRGLTEQQLDKMSRTEMENLLYSTSKNITASVRKLKKSDYGVVSQFLGVREKNKYPMPREIKLKTAKRMGIEQLKQELRDLSYTANLQTYNISGTKEMLKDFESKTGKSLIDLISVEKAEKQIIDELIKSHYETSGVVYTENEIIGKYGDSALIEQARKLISDRWDKIRTTIEEKKKDGYSSTSVINAYDITKEDVIGNLDEIELAEEKAKQTASKELSNSDMFNLVK